MVGRNGDRFSRVLISSRKHQTNGERRRKGGTRGLPDEPRNGARPGSNKQEVRAFFQIERNPFDLLSSIKRVVTIVVT
jgi:hypothetical protein